MLYSHHQLALVSHLTGYLSHCRYSRRNNRVYPTLPEPGAFLTARAPASQYRRIALMATALEARYLPVIDPDYVHLVNAEFDEHEAYRASFDPVTMSQLVGYPPDPRQEGC